MASSSSNVVGVHYRVGKKIGEGSFGVIFEGTNLLNNQQVAIKFVCSSPYGRIAGASEACENVAREQPADQPLCIRNLARATLPN